MRRWLCGFVLVLGLASFCKAQFLPCRFGEATTVQEKDGITARHLTVIEASGPVSAVAFIPKSPVPIPGIIFTHSTIQSSDTRVDIVWFARALALAGAAGIVVDGTVQVPNNNPPISPHLLACAGQWLLENANLDRKRLAAVGSHGAWGGGNAPLCMGETPCWGPILNLHFGIRGDPHNGVSSIPTMEDWLRKAKSVQHYLKLSEINAKWLHGMETPLSPSP